MKRFRYLLGGLGTVLLLSFAAPVSAQMMGGSSMMSGDSNASTSSSTDADVQKGQDIYSQLQNKTTTCDKLTDDDFDVLGDFFMNRMMGSAHDTMDQYMTQNLGADGEKQAHITMGKRLSGCNVNASYPSGAGDYPSMAWMGMMTSGSNGWGMMDDSWNMAGYDDNSWSGTDTLLAILLVIAIAVAVFAWFRPRTLAAKKKSKK